MIYKLQYRLKSELVKTETKEDVSESFDKLLDKVKSLIGYEWTVLVDKDVWKDDKMIENHGCFTVADSRIERSELTAQIEANPVYKDKEIDLIRADFINQYDLRNLNLQ